MFAIDEMGDNLKSALSLSALFDFYRLVDVQTYEVLEYAKDFSDVKGTHQTCHHIWGSDGPCINCTSRTCVQRGEAIVKLMHLDNQYLLIYSVPVTVCGKHYALELIKDITRSLMVPSIDVQDNIEITEMVAQFNDLAAHDTFTHLFNKNYVLNELRTATDDCKKSDEDPTLSLVMIDLDLFKNINDEFGHTIGDDVLLMLARTLSSITLKFEGSWAARYGGDEFILCAPGGIDEQGEAFIRECLVAYIADVKKYVSGSPTINVSFGTATLRKDDTVRSLIDRADERMYEMKERHHAEMDSARV